MTRQDPGLDRAAIAATLREHYGLTAAEVAYLSLGHDFAAAVYAVRAEEAHRPTHFLKIRSGPPFEPGLLVPQALADRDIPNILAPLRTRSGDLWCPLAGTPDPGRSAVLYPFVGGEDAAAIGLTDAQWRTFGRTLRAVHDGGFADTFRDRLRAEDFSLPSAALVRHISKAVAAGGIAAGAAAERLASFWRENADRIAATLTRAEALGHSLRGKPFAHALCHGDIHAANILVGADGRIHLIDWDGPLLAPRERDLLFVIGSRIARRVEPWEEAAFFAGYGPVAVDPEALIYFRYERIVEDLGEFGRSVFLDRDLAEASKAGEVDLTLGLFAPGGDLDRAEAVSLARVPPPTNPAAGGAGEGARSRAHR